jgi:starch phosphorylase
MHLADLKSYLHAHEQTESLYADQSAWAKKTVSNIAGSGKFSSDRTIAEYAEDIWHLDVCPVAPSGSLRREGP